MNAILLTGVIALAPLAALESDEIQGQWKGTTTVAGNGHQSKVVAKIAALGGNKYGGIVHVTDPKGDVHEAPISFEVETKGSAVTVTGSSEMKGEPVKVSGTISEGSFTGSFDAPEEKGTFALTREKLKSPTAGKKAPEGAIVLFDGKSLNAWKKARSKNAPAGWKVVDGAMQVVPKSGSVQSKQPLGDGHYHIEFKTPFMPESRGQARGNSGVYFQGRYEVQVLDSFGQPPRDNEAGGIYKVSVPKVNASYPPGEWQTYDVDFEAPKFEGGKMVAPGKITVRHNGVVIHEDVELTKTTNGAADNKMDQPGGVMLQDHGNPVEYRNLWMMPKK
ncbi:hypothetical protein Pan216_13810 [Planctomycetes bacterium Pan216]|uniref:3-keto-alpha-glucoside-1,2-lyase/3-keto-2-hydroxy-glucal hydratase domain-containing protein n=1 Tax=Kolteria novifilia TaxID=2527975 RepID=A0A518B0N0_9BACT|nr:hypothetical protein Pan216_13810 [Planctomycetes bacterium Pan216]